ncbi:MAG: nucleotide exchange factor GrpE [Pseudomonadota bacterium]|nr:nucleotide exchange factor GrpE [Pseudomonadota bacterium]
MKKSTESAENPIDPVDADIPLPAEASKENQLQEEIDRLTEESARMRDQWMRAVAETENVRKRGQREQEETAKYAVTNFARDMVSVLENLKRASESIPADARAGNELLKTLGEGVDLTLQELLAIFNRHGIERLDPINQKFDHNFHQAVAQIERGDVPPGTVIQVMQAGYTLNGRLLRPAMVAVSKQADAPKKVDETA